ncbi:hypothetical protein [Photorhabdus sp. RM323S]|uniref:hypothetical protein n=1 Tax=Photorhabdus sp. RM323S TaxID=3342828 RepID=UPI0036D8D75D
MKIQDGGQMIGGISTSKELSIAMNYAALYEGYVYAVRANGVDLLEYFVRIKAPSGVIKNATTQMEIACEKILAKDVLAARRVLFLNLHFIPNDKFYECNILTLKKFNSEN